MKQNQKGLQCNSINGFKIIAKLITVPIVSKMNG